jgi:hypothetical protein
LSGIWFVVWPKEGLERGDREGVGPYLPDFMPKGAEIPLQPQAAALHKQRSENFGAGRPSSMCLPHSVPDAMLVSPFKVVQTRDVTLILLKNSTTIDKSSPMAESIRRMQIRHGSDIRSANGKEAPSSSTLAASMIVVGSTTMVFHIRSVADDRTLRTP